VPARRPRLVHQPVKPGSASGRMPYSSSCSSSGRKACPAAMIGADPAAPEEYTDAFRFHRDHQAVSRIDLSGELIPDSEAEMKIAMRRQ